jgi:hypothetical protein
MGSHPQNPREGRNHDLRGKGPASNLIWTAVNFCSFEENLSLGRETLAVLYSYRSEKRH